MGWLIAGIVLVVCGGSAANDATKKNEPRYLAISILLAAAICLAVAAAAIS